MGSSRDHDLGAGAVRVEGAPRLNASESLVLKMLHERYGDYGYCAFATIAADTGLKRPVVRRACRSLARKGLTHYASGLSNEDGEFFGSGYCCTDEGYALLGPDDDDGPWDVAGEEARRDTIGCRFLWGRWMERPYWHFARDPVVRSFFFLCAGIGPFNFRICRPDFPADSGVLSSAKRTADDATGAGTATGGMD